MIDGKTVLAIVPARGGSKGVPNKNIRSIGGKPLIAWTIEAAQKSAYIDRLILSSDDAEIIKIAQALGCEVPFVRLAELALDDTPGIDPVLHALDVLPEYDLVLLLQPTSPLRGVDDIDGCIDYCVAKHANVCVSVTESHQSPYWMYTLAQDSTISPLLKNVDAYTRRQDFPPAYILNGAIYVAHCTWLRTHRTFLTEETLAYAMPQERSLDIDTELDLRMLEMMLQKKN